MQLLFELGEFSQLQVYPVTWLQHQNAHGMNNDGILRLLANVDFIVLQHFYQADLHLIRGEPCA